MIIFIFNPPSPVRPVDPCLPKLHPGLAPDILAPSPTLLCHLLPNYFIPATTAIFTKWE